MPPFALSDEDAAKVAEEYARGVTRGEIAARFGVHPNTVTRVIRRSGIPQRKGRVRVLTGESERRVVDLYAAGLATAEIAAEHGISTQMVSRVAIAAGIPARRSRPGVQRRTPQGR